MEEKVFHCYLWNSIKVDNLALSIINTTPFQRLHYIKQTGLLYKVFPTATHTRFQHSLGVYHVTRKLLNKLEENHQVLGLTHRQKQLICIAGLVHDLGHGPFSHLYDDYLKHKRGHETNDETMILPTHEERSCQILKHIMQTPHPITKEKINLNMEEYIFICDCISKPQPGKWYYHIINNPYSSFDVDKIDYLLRDARQIGIPSTFNIERILENITIKKGELCFSEKIHHEIEKMFTMREEMYMMIYQYPKVQKYQSFVLKFMMEKEFTGNSLLEFLKLSDEKILEICLTERQREEFETGRGPGWEDISVSEYQPDNQKSLALRNINWIKKESS